MLSEVRSRFLSGRKIIPILLFGAFTTVNAQIVITDTDFPTIGTTFWMAIDNETPTGLDLGVASTTPQTWDFTSLITDSLYEIGFNDPATVDPNNDFPTADLTLDQFGGYAFAEITSDDVQLIGIIADFGAALGLGSLEASISFQDPWKIFEFPSQVGTAYLDTASFDFSFDADGVIPALVIIVSGWDPDSLRIFRTVYVDAEIDAEGVLTDVLTNDHNVLRQFVVEHSIDSVWGYVDGVWDVPPAALDAFFENPTVTIDSNYRFISKEMGYIVAEIDVDGQGNPNSATFLSDPSFCCSGVEEIIAAGGNVLYPNPANEYVQVRTGGDIYQMEIMDMSGKLLLNERLTYDGQVVQLDQLANGLYIYRLMEENGRMAHTGRLSRIH